MAQIIATAMRGVRRSSSRRRARGPSGRGGGGAGLSRRKNSQTPARFSAAAAT